MKTLLASIAALSLVASPAFAAQKPAPSTKTVTTKSGNTKATTTVSTKGNTTTAKTTMSKVATTRSHKKARRHYAAASKTIARQAKAEKESVATEVKEHRAAAAKHHRLSHKAAMKSSKTTKG